MTAQPQLPAHNLPDVQRRCRRILAAAAYLSHHARDLEEQDSAATIKRLAREIETMTATAMPWADHMQARQDQWTNDQEMWGGRR